MLLHSVYVWCRTLGDVEGLFDLRHAIVMGDLLGEFNNGRCGGQGASDSERYVSKTLGCLSRPNATNRLSPVRPIG